MLTREQEEQAIAETLADLRGIGNSLDRRNSYRGTSSTSSSRKEGRAISRSNHEIIKTHVDSLHKAADLLHGAADDLATILQGSEKPYANEGTPAEGQQEGKSHYGRYSASQGYEVKAFDPKTTVEKSQKTVASLNLPEGSMDWIQARFVKGMESKMGIK